MFNSGVKQLKQKIYVLIRLSKNFAGLLSTLSRTWKYHFFFFSFFHFCTYSREITDVFPEKLARSRTLFKPGFFFKMCIVITLLEVYQLIPGSMTLTLFQGHRCVGIINCKLFFFKYFSLDSCPPSFKHCMVLTLKRVRHSMLCVTGVYLRDIDNTIFFFLFNFALWRESS